ncbi:MAG: hypothetical protein ABJB12_15745 [Pseudomonadota bacterium]
MSLIYRASTLLFVSCAALAAALACTGSSEPGPLGIGAGGSSADGGQGGSDSSVDDAIPTSLAFTPATTLRLAPKQTRVLTIMTTPPGSFRVRFALLGAAADAVLNANDVPTGADGSARVTLTASSTPTSFSVRASVAGKGQASVQTLVGVSVSALGYTTLSVKPSYSGRRTVTEWTASIHPSEQCNQLRGSPPPDGDLLTVGGAEGPLVIEEVPVGVGLAVTLRAGHYIGGCANVGALGEGDGNEALVYASDRAVNFDQTELDLSFGPSDVRPDFSKLMKAAEAQAVAALLGTAANDAAALLDAMRDATPALTRDAFSSERVAQRWDSALVGAFGSNAATRLRDPADRWMSAGLAAFDAPNSFVGRLSPTADGARFDLTSVAQHPPADAGFPSRVPSTWSSDTSDTVLIGTELHWVPSRLMVALAAPPALMEFPSATSAPDALALSVDCALVARTLLAHGATPGAAVYPTCDESCALRACTTGINALWDAASNASDGALAVLGVTAAGTAQVGDEAEVVSLHGSWLGTLTQGEASASASGALVARAPNN